MKHFLLVLILITSNILMGCGFKDIDKRIFVTNIGIDKGTDDEDLYKVTLRLAVPSGNIKEGHEQEYVYLIENNATISHAVRKMKASMDKELDFAHSKVIVIGENVIDGNLENIIDWFSRRRDIQKIAWIVMAEGNAEDVLKSKPKSERLASEALINIFDKIGTESPYVHTEYFSEFRRDLLEQGVDAILPVVKIKKGGSETYVLNQVAIYKSGEEWKLIKLQPEETRILNMLKEFEQDIGFEIDSEEEKFLFSADVIKVKYKLKENTKAIITYDIMLEGILEEKKGVFKYREVNKYNKLVEEEVKTQVENLLLKLQKENVDPIGFGIRYRSTTFSQEDRMEKWKTLYPATEFVVNVKAKIKSSGVTE